MWYAMATASCSVLTSRKSLTVKNMSEKRIKKQFVKDLQDRQQVQDLFLVCRYSLAETKTGKPYLALTLTDKSGEIEARMWDNAEQFAVNIEEGSFVETRGVVQDFQGVLQMKLLHLSPIPPSIISLQDFLPASKRAVEEMILELQERIATTADPALKKLLQHLFQGETLKLFSQAPAAKKMHHAYIGGLIEHTLSMAHMAEAAARHYPLLNYDLLMAGVLLHDLAKIEEFDFSSPSFSYTDRGRLVGHLVLGVEMVRRAAAEIIDIPASLLDQLSHLILSHHGQLEFGSPVLPMTPEAMLLHHIDDMDAKMNYLSALQEQVRGTDWEWTPFQRPLQRFLFLPGSDGLQQAENKPERMPSVKKEETHPSAKKTQKEDAAKLQQTLFGDLS